MMATRMIMMATMTSIIIFTVINLNTSSGRLIEADNNIITTTIGDDNNSNIPIQL